MHLLFYSFFLIFFVKMQAHSIPPSLEIADGYFEATLFEKAIPLYETLIQSEQLEIEKSELILRLAKSHFYLENYEEAIHTLASNFLKNSCSSDLDMKVYSEGLYLLGLASKKAGFPDIFFTAMEGYINSDPQKNLPFHPTAHFTLASAYDERQNWSKAKEHFAQIKSGENKAFPGLYEKAQIALAKIEKKEGNSEKGKEILEKLEIFYSETDPLRYELQFLKGEAALVLGEDLLAVKAFELAIPNIADIRAPWKGDAFFYLGQCYLLLAEQELTSSLQRQHYFDRSELYLKKHLSIDPKEEGFLTLGKLYLAKGSLLDDKEAFSKAQEVLSQTDRFSNPENLSHSLLLRTKLPLPYHDLDLIYRELTSDAKAASNFYPQGWYLRGANDYQHGIMLLEQGEIQEARPFLEQSAKSFEKAFHLLKEKEGALALQAIHCLLQALFKIDTHHSYLKAFNCLNQILENESIKCSNDEDELKYWHALAASQLAEKENKPELLEIAKSSLTEILEKYPEGKKREQSFHLLGILQYKKHEEEAEKTFLKLCEIYPESPLIPEALFYAARCADRDVKGTERAKNYRKQVYERFPDSHLAPESYFFYFPFQDYLTGNKEAILHLKEFTRKYSESRLVLTAFYLLGMNYKKDTKTPEGKWINKKNLNQAIEFFQDVESVFDCLIKKEAIPEDELRYFITIRYQAALERALANQSIADEASGAKKQIFLEYAVEVLQAVVSDFQNKEHPLAKLLYQQEPFPRILEEANFHLAETYAKLQDDEKGERLLQGMLEKYQSAKITRGYYLSRTFYELGMIETRRRDWQAALDFFLKAEDAAKGKVLNADQKIDLWIQQSLCYRGMGQIDKAMLILSKAINDDAISSLRLKAMFIRADIYASEGRNELAKKQLEAISKKGGHWALKAKQKLDADYDP